MISTNASQHFHKDVTLSIHNLLVGFKLIDSGVNKSVYFRNSVQHVTPFSITFLQFDVERLNDLLLNRLQYVACRDLRLFGLLLFQSFILFESEFRFIVSTSLDSRRLPGNLNGIHEHRIWWLHLCVMGGANTATSAVWLQNLVIAVLSSRLSNIEWVNNSEILHHIVIYSLL